MKASGPNAEQIQYWNEQAGPNWVRGKSQIDALVEPLGQAAVEAAELRAGERVLDVGCGTGQTSLDLAGRVGANGEVLGVDISRPMLERARSEAEDTGLSQLSFENADAQTHAFSREHFDLVFSRFGVMFFSDPVAAFSNLRSALRSYGRLVFVCWQTLAQNDWMRVPLAALAEHLELSPPGDPEAPGPFAFSDSKRVREILDASGFQEIEIVSRERPLRLGESGGFDEAVQQALGMGPAGAAYRAASREIQVPAADAVRRALLPYAGPEGVHLDSASWIVRARP